VHEGKRILLIVNMWIQGYLNGCLSTFSFPGVPWSSWITCKVQYAKYEEEEGRARQEQEQEEEERATTSTQAEMATW